MKTNKPFYALRKRMVEFGVTQSDIADAYNDAYGTTRTNCYFSARFNGLHSFTLREAYFILALVGVPTSDIAEYFPAEVAA